MPREPSDRRDRRRRSRSPSPRESSRRRNVEKLSKRVAKHLRKHHVPSAVDGDNRFQDPNLNERFIWNKKIERDIEKGASFRELDARSEKRKQQTRLEEIERAKRSREEREAERARQQDELSMIERARLAAEAANALEKEEEFLLQQAVASCKARIENGRMRPIDALVRILLPEFCWGQTDPAYKVLQKMNVDELEQLKSEIQEFKVLDCQHASHVEYWNCIETVCKHELSLARKQESVEGDRTTSGDRSNFNRERQLHVEDEIQTLLAGKTLTELEQMETEINDLLKSTESIDPDYWTRVLEYLEMEKIKTKIRSIQAEVQKSALDYMDAAAQSQKQSAVVKMKWKEEVEEASSDEEVMDVDCPSPDPLTSIEGMEVVHEDEDYDQIAILRRQVKLESSASFRKNVQDGVMASSGFKASGSQRGGRLGVDVKVEEDDGYDRMKSDAILTMGSDEDSQPFGGEVRLDSQVYWWHEKYRPRKPKYFNRVHTGYEWNKYNQTHYDHDNPPPKVVQGYKFNVFYPDLIDKKMPPYYEIQGDPSSKDSATCWLRFKAGPPYEDLAFRIVNKEWEYSHKKGFKCTFERGILHLYFNFKRQRYRR